MIKAFLPAVLWASVIFILSSNQSLPNVASPDYDVFVKKFAHITVYAVLYWLLLWGTMRVSSPQQPRLRFFLPVLICFFYALSDELHQTFVPGRFGTLRDVGYDMLGVWITLLWQGKYI